jgi:hypothetical protein
MIGDDRAEAAVMMLRDTAAEYGKARGYMAFCDANLRRVKSIQMLSDSQGSVADREARAYASDAYLEAITQLQEATAHYETLRARREAAAMGIEVYRSQNSARKAGINI